MLQMLNQEAINKFYSDVNSLGLKFPVAAITKATGFNKGTVSEYLSKKKEPSQKFIDAFYAQFAKSLENVPREKMTTYSNMPPFQTKGGISDDAVAKIIKEKDERIKELKEQIEFLKTVIQQNNQKR